MSADWTVVAWPASRLGEAIETLARRSGFEPHSPPPPTPTVLSVEDLGRWVIGASDVLGIEAEPVGCLYPDLNELITRSGPAVLKLPGNDGFLLVLRSPGRRVHVLGMDFAVHRLDPNEVRDAVAQEVERPAAVVVDSLLEPMPISEKKRARARHAMIRDRLRHEHVPVGWILRVPPGGDLPLLIRTARLPRYLGWFLVAHVSQYTLTLVSWWIIGRGALEGHLDWGWLTAWALLLATVIPFRLAETWLQGLLAVGAGALLKQRLLQGALRLNPDELRHQGSGHHLGRVIESEAVESLALSGGFLGLVTVLELVLVLFIFLAAAGAWLHGVLLLGWTALTAALGWRYFVARRAWTVTRLSMSHELVEHMVGHRTRIAQERPEQWHESEDRSLAQYAERSRAMDRGVALLVGLPRGWLAIGLLGFAPAFAAGDARVGRLAVILGGVLLAMRAFSRLVTTISFLTDAAIAWTQVSPLFHAAARKEPIGDPTLSLAGVPSDGRPVLEVSEISYQYPSRPEPVLRGCNLAILSGDRVLLESASGGGKSTLVSVVNGLRSPGSGLLLVHGLDRHTLGANGWTRRVATAPQFHENHVISETFAFNALMGRGWPPSAEDSREAETICRELGLGKLLDSMPAGLLQMVGESGWQLSHGERSRLFIARTLLQGADLIVLDESFGALDPMSLRQALDCVLARAPSLLVIAHP